MLPSLLDCIMVCPAATTNPAVAFLGSLCLAWSSPDGDVPQLLTIDPVALDADSSLQGLDVGADSAFRDSKLWAWSGRDVDYSLRSLSFTLSPLLTNNGVSDKAQVQVLKRLLTLLRSDKPPASEGAVRTSLRTLSHLDFFHDSINWLLLANA